MKIRTFLIGLAGFFIMSSCEKEPPTLPAETQEGLGTFGCLINGELVLANSIWRSGKWVQDVSAYYNSATDLFIIEGCTEESRHSFRFFVTNPKVGQCEAVFAFWTANIYYKVRGVSYINFTRFDGNIASGTFVFDADRYNTWNDTPVVPPKEIQVRKGRFDVTFHHRSY